MLQGQILRKIVTLRAASFADRRISTELRSRLLRLRSFAHLRFVESGAYSYQVNSTGVQKPDLVGWSQDDNAFVAALRWEKQISACWSYERWCVGFWVERFSGTWSAMRMP